MGTELAPYLTAKSDSMKAIAWITETLIAEAGQVLGAFRVSAGKQSGRSHTRGDSRTINTNANVTAGPGGKFYPIPLRGLKDNTAKQVASS